MKHIPSSKIDQAADIIRSAILSGDLVQVLPSERRLSEQLQISRASVRKALEALTREGMLAPVQASKKRLIIETAGVRKKVENKQVIFLSQKPAHESSSQVLEQFAQLNHYLSKAGYVAEMVTSGIFHYNQVLPEQMEELTARREGAHWILHQCPEHVQLWFAACGIRATVFGSIFPTVGLPFVDVDFCSAARHATGYLLARGHKRLGLIRFRSHLAGDDCAFQGMVDGLMSHAEYGALAAPQVLTHNFDVGRLTYELNQLFAKPDAPTGLLVVNFHHMVTVMTHLPSIGISIPEDVSIISLCHDEVLEYFSPKPTCYGCGEQLVMQQVRMVLGYDSGACEDKGSLLIPEQIVGHSVRRV